MAISIAGLRCGAVHVQSLTVVAVLVALPAPAAVAEERERFRAIEEVVVTARHRKEDLQSVPVAMSAVGGGAVEDARINTLQALEHMVPNLVFGETGTSGETHVGIRGIGDFSRNIGFDTRVGVYVDGVFAGQSLAVDAGLVDLAQVEVLRGPQGTLFGKNSSSGAISINSNRPRLGEAEGSVRLGGGNFDKLYGEGVVNVPLGDKAAARMAVTGQRQDGYVDNLFDGRDLMTDDHTFARLRFRLQPADDLEINVSYDVHERDNDILFLEPDAGYEDAVGNPAAGSRYVVDQDADLIDENSSSGTSITADYILPNGSALTSITGYRTADRKVGSDEDATRAFTLHARYFEDDFEHFTQELRLASPDDHALRYVLGLFYFDQDADTNRVVALGPALGGPPGGVNAAVQNSAVDTQTVAMFVNGTFDIGERWSIGGGLRWSDESKDARIDQSVFPGFGLAQRIEQSFDRDEDYATATANVQYQMTDQALAYARYASGYKAGGFNVDLVPTVDDLSFEEETVDSYEIGVKSDFWDGRVRLNAAAFYARYDDYQVFQFRFDPVSGTTALLISNAAEVTTKGFEVEGTARLTDRLEVQYGLGYTDATFDDFPGGAVDAQTGAPVNVAGNRLPRAPEYTASVAARYLFPAGALSVDYTWRDEQYFNPDNRPGSRQPDYGLLNASLDFDLNRRWSVGVWGRNLADETYRGMRGASFLGVPFSLYMQPRTYGADITYRY